MIDAIVAAMLLGLQRAGMRVEMIDHRSFYVIIGDIHFYCRVERGA